MTVSIPWGRGGHYNKEITYTELRSSIAVFSMQVQVLRKVSFLLKLTFRQVLLFVLEKLSSIQLFFIIILTLIVNPRGPNCVIKGEFQSEVVNTNPMELSN